MSSLDCLRQPQTLQDFQFVMAPYSQKDRKNQETVEAPTQNQTSTTTNSVAKTNKLNEPTNSLTNLKNSEKREETLTKTETRRLREKHFGPNIQLFFEQDPLKIVRGAGQYLFDENDVKYLDCNSNVNHVGHSHPKVAEAVYKQMLTLNVNSRFLNDNLCEYRISSNRSRTPNIGRPRLEAAGSSLIFLS